MKRYLTNAARRRRSYMRRHEHRMPSELKACLDDIRLAWPQARWIAHPNPYLAEAN